MVVALLLLSLAMIVGGVLSAAFGWDIVLNERGWVMVIAGATVATGGALVLALAALAARLGRIRAELAEIRDRTGRPEPALPSAPALDPVAAVASGLLAGAAEPGRPPEPEPGELRLPAFLQPEREPDAPPAPEAAPPPPPEPDREPAAPDPLFADLDRPPEAGPDAEAAPKPDIDRPPAPPLEGPEGGPEERPAGDAEEAPARPEPAVAPAPEPAEAAPEEPPAEPEPGRAVIGTYTSGHNRYVMFADGSIEAETPDGTFHFASLDELKAFIAAGGEDRPEGAGPA
jgi:hypothetical protein